MTPIPPALRASFQPVLRTRGEEYVREGRVQVLEATPSRVTATVRGADTYEVVLRAVGESVNSAPSDTHIELHCTCPYARDHGVCKHCWAVIVTCARNGTLPQVSDEAYVLGRSLARDASERARAARQAREAEHDSRLRRQLDEIAPLPEPEPPPPPDTRPWVRQLRAIADSMAFDEPTEVPEQFPAGRRVTYTVDVHATRVQEAGLVIEIGLAAPQKDGTWRALKQVSLTRAQWLAAPEAEDREILQRLIGTPTALGAGSFTRGTRVFVVPAESMQMVVRPACETERCVLRLGDGTMLPLAWDAGPAWTLEIDVSPDIGESYQLEAWLQRDGERIRAQDATVLTNDGITVVNGRVAEWEHHDAGALVRQIALGTFRTIPHADAMDLLRELYALPQLPPVTLPVELSDGLSDDAPTPRLSLRRFVGSPWMAAGFDASVSFDYGGVIIAAGERQTPRRAGITADGTSALPIRRHRSAEAAAVRRVEQAGFRREFSDELRHSVLRIGDSRMLAAVVALVSEGWTVDVGGRELRTGGEFEVEVRSGIDWFDVHAGVQFGTMRASLPQLLAGLRRGDLTVSLDDGSLGVLDASMLQHAALLARAGQLEDGHLRFSAQQLGILDVLLSMLPSFDADTTFETARKALEHFDGVRAADPPPGFQGTLREYQREGLGWMHFLRDFGFGGCLADDMGLGKTVQVLALLEARRAEGAGPSIVVVPRSLMFNWQQEAARFAPLLRVIPHRGADRLRDTESFTAAVGADGVVLTTFGTLRRDILMLRDVHFDYAILDEAQSIKNAATASAKSARLIRATHRLAMSGTPVENSLRELWSLLDFLNPGVFGKASVFATLTKQLAANGETESGLATRALVARAVRPYILRRTKAQVASELPERIEQTILVDLLPKERALYDELRDHYRTSLLGKVGSRGLGQHRMHVLEALLRLRQAACHPGLIDPSRIDDPGSKLDLLVSRLQEAASEGHKTLVFSQFTSLLAIVRSRLDALAFPYAYLDGGTRDRQSAVERFQNDPDCHAFLISIKAGGLGLNLTAAEHVYLLDPWWNPAVEAQAIDRAHRLGQTRTVFAARLIARGTVEEKVLALQAKKRDLADAIIRADGSLLSSLDREDLELLLS